AVRIAKSQHRRWPVHLDMRLHEGCSLGARARQVFHIVDAFAAATKEAGRAILGDIASRRHDGGGRGNFASEGGELVLVAPGAMKHEENRSARFTGKDLVDVAVPGHGRPQSPSG